MPSTSPFFISPALSKCPRCCTCPSWPFIQLPLYQLLDILLQFAETTRIFIYFYCWNCRFLLSVKLPQKSEIEIGQAKLHQWVRIETKREKVAKDQQGRSRHPTVKVALVGNFLESTKTWVLAMHTALLLHRWTKGQPPFGEAAPNSAPT